jgi:hypothetical protein
MPPLLRVLLIVRLRRTDIEEKWKSIEVHHAFASPMFQLAAAQHFAWRCDVSSLPDLTTRRAAGNGCMLDDKHILTARHVCTGIRPPVLRPDGIFSCEVVFESSEYDIAVLRTTSRESKPFGSVPSSYPRLSTDQLFLGSCVGVLSALYIRKRGS